MLLVVKNIAHLKMRLKMKDIQIGQKKNYRLETSESYFTRRLLPDADVLLLVGQLVLVGVIVGVDHAGGGAV